MSVTWARVSHHGRTVYWNGTSPDGWRLSVSRVADGTGGSRVWKFGAFQPVPGSAPGRRVHDSEPVGTVIQARRAAEAWLAARTQSPDPGAEYWTVDDVAAYAGLAHLTIIQYHARGQMPRRDKRTSTLLWRPDRIRAWRPQAEDQPERLCCPDWAILHEHARSCSKRAKGPTRG